jgi:hypothetical protein
MTTSVQDLCNMLPPQIEEYFDYCTKELKFGDRPAYDELLQKLEQIGKEFNIQQDDKFDWVMHK